MADKKIRINSVPLDQAPIDLLAHDNGDGTYSLQPYNASEAAAATVLGATADAAVDTDTTGTVSGKLRGLVKLLVNLLSRWPAALGAGGGLKVDGSGTAIPVSGTFYPTTQPTSDAGPAWALTRTYTTSADMTTAAALTAAPTAGQKIVAADILISSDTAMLFSVQMETSANVLAAVRLAANGTAHITMRGQLKGDAADKKLYGKASAAGNVYITAVYFSEA
jgi:hypothetical protein